MDSITQEDLKGNPEEIEVLESYVLNSRVYNIIDSPTDEVIPEG